MEILTSLIALCLLVSCTSDNKVMEENKKIKGIIVGSSKSDKKKRFEEMHPEVKKSINRLIETNKGNVPTTGSK